MKERNYTATVMIHEDNTLAHAHRRKMVQFEYKSAHRNGSKANMSDCKLSALRKYGELAIPCEIRFTHIIHR